MKCRYCEEVFDTSIRMFKHIRRTHYNIVLVCEICGKEFETKSGLSNHISQSEDHISLEEYYTKYPIPEKIWKEYLKQLLDSHITINKDTGCWECSGWKDRSGYVSFYSNSAHRISYNIYKGNIPDGLLVCHSCDNPCCVNPDHLWIGTNQDNMDDMVRKGRTLKGDRNPSCRPEVRKKISIKKSGKNHHMYGKHHTEESKIKISKSLKNNGNQRVKSIYAEGNYYNSITEAVEKTGLSRSTILRRLKAGLKGYRDE